MAYLFPSEEWLKEYQNQINSNSDYKKAASEWTAGAVSLVVLQNPSIGLNQDYCIWLDLHQGVCRSAKTVNKEEAEKAPFVITGDYSRWKQVVKKQLDPIQGMMQGKLKLKGNLPTIVRFVKAAQELVNSATKVETRFLDE